MNHSYLCHAIEAKPGRHIYKVAEDAVALTVATRQSVWMIHNNTAVYVTQEDTPDTIIDRWTKARGKNAD